jgi:hypothetical protein
MKTSELHQCDGGDFPYYGYGSAADTCAERPDGSLWIDNGEYSTRVNYCPFCGFEAKEPWRKE